MQTTLSVAIDFVGHGGAPSDTRPIQHYSPVRAGARPDHPLPVIRSGVRLQASELQLFSHNLFGSLRDHAAGPAPEPGRGSQATKVLPRVSAN
jgi:hypothetical protein